MNITYTMAGEHLMPDLVLPEGQMEAQGIWAIRRRNFLKEECRPVYYSMMTSGRLAAHLAKTQQEAERYFQLCLFDAVNLCGCLVGKRSPYDDVLHLAPFLLHIRYKSNLCPRPYEVVLRVSGFEVGIAHQVIGEKTDAAFEGH